ncbi:MAG TPA: hypothetical protein VK841_01110 [Polyangiaceae bacterium]|nr:hypothetical protein [Polyangiaceae bacterium]
MTRALTAAAREKHAAHMREVRAARKPAGHGGPREIPRKNAPSQPPYRTAHENAAAVEPEPEPIARVPRDTRPYASPEACVIALQTAAAAARAALAPPRVKTPASPPDPRLPLPPAWPAIRQNIHVLDAGARAATILRLLLEVEAREKSDGELGGVV